MTTPTKRRQFLGVTPTVLALGVVALFMDASSEMVAPILPLFVTGTLGASAATLGLIEAGNLELRNLQPWCDSEGAWHFIQRTAIVIGRKGS